MMMELFWRIKQLHDPLRMDQNPRDPGRWSLDLGPSDWIRPFGHFVLRPHNWSLPFVASHSFLRGFNLMFHGGETMANETGIPRSPIIFRRLFKRKMATMVQWGVSQGQALVVEMTWILLKDLWATILGG